MTNSPDQVFRITDSGRVCVRTFQNANRLHQFVAFAAAATNRITSPGYSFDADGHLTNDGVNTLTYDAEDRIVSSSGSGGSATYSHRPTGHRVMKTAGTNTTVYVYSQNRLIAEYLNGTLSKRRGATGTCLTRSAVSSAIPNSF